MNIRVVTLRLALGMSLVTPLSGFASSSSLMQTTSQIGPSPEYALVIFLALSPGSASVDPLRGGTAIWDGDSLVGFVGTHQALQYKAAPGSHIFVLYSRTIGGINAQLLAGKSYFVNIKRGLISGVSLEAIKPTDARIDPWPVSLEFVALDAAAWDAQRQKYECNFVLSRKLPAKTCQMLENIRSQDIDGIRNEECAVHPFDPLQTTCRYLALRPEDGG
jgi:hypothetical protein